MMDTKAKIRCGQCESWVQVSGDSDTVMCSCGAVFAVTITRIAKARA